MYWLYAASLLSALTALLHIFGGGVAVARPVLNSDLNDEAKYTSYYCWHMVTIIIVAMSVCFFLAGRYPELRELGVLCCILSFAFAVWSVVLIIAKKQKLLKLPQWILFFPIAIIGAAGLLL